MSDYKENFLGAIKWCFLFTFVFHTLSFLIVISVSKLKIFLYEKYRRPNCKPMVYSEQKSEVSVLL